MATIADIRNGFTFKYNNQIYSVLEYQHVKQARASGFYRVKMKSLNTGKIIEQSFNSGTKLDEVRIERRKYQYSYDDGSILVFMDTNTWEQINVEKRMIEDMSLLLEGEECEVLFNTADENILSVELPPNVVREVTYTEPGIKGDTATNTLKPATVEGGAEVRVPLFINIGDKVKIDTSTKKYMERVEELTQTPPHYGI